MSLLEGHGDVTMDRAGADQIPNATRFGQVLRQRRQQGNVAVKLLQKLIGLEAKLKQYEQGEQFIEEVEGAGGPSSSSGRGSGPRTCPPSGRSAIRVRGSPGSAPPPSAIAAMGLADDLLARCTFPPDLGPVSCAVSGGADSLALLVLARHAGLEATAVHVDHGLRPGSAAEADVVAAAAQRLGAGFRAVQAAVEPGPNLEARARAARYAVLPSDVLTGHTADDQAETVLLNLLRGSGSTGWPASATGPAARCSGCVGPRPRRCARLSGSSPWTTRPTVIPASVATASATSCSAHRRHRRATSCRSSPARPDCCAPTPTCWPRSPRPSTPPARPRCGDSRRRSRGPAVRAWLRPALGGRPPAQRPCSGCSR